MLPVRLEGVRRGPPERRVPTVQGGGEIRGPAAGSGSLPRGRHGRSRRVLVVPNRKGLRSPPVFGQRQYIFNPYFLILTFIGADGPELETLHGTEAERLDIFPPGSFARIVKYTRWLRFIPSAVGSKSTEVERVEEASGFRLLSERVKSVVQYAE